MGIIETAQNKEWHPKKQAFEKKQKEQKKESTILQFQSCKDDTTKNFIWEFVLKVYAKQ